MTDAEKDMERPDEWLLIKRDLYWRPNSCGYTGLRDEAGRYTHAEASRKCNEGVSMVHISEAPEWRASIWDEVLVEHLIKLRAEQADTITTLRAEVEEWKDNWQRAAANGIKDSDRADKAEAERDSQQRLAIAAIARAEKAEAALWPFARIKMVPYSVMASDDASIELSGFELIDGKAFIKASAFRAALASLTEGE